MYESFCKENAIIEPLGRQAFLQLWRSDCAWIKLRQTHSPFTKCGLCEFLKGCAQAAQDMEVRHAVLTRLATHYEFAAAQRLCLSYLWKKSEANPLQLCLMSMDKMDQMKTIFPRFAAMQQADFMKTATRLRVGIVGCYIPGVYREPIVATTFDDQVHGSNMISSLLIQNLMLVKHALGDLPEALYLHADTTYKETKNTITIVTMVWLLCQLEGTRLKEMHLVFLMVGHTHDLVDAFFAQISQALTNQDCFSISELKEIMSRAMTHPPIWSHLQNVYNFKDVRPRGLTADALPGIGTPHHIRLRWGRARNICLSTKRWLSDTQFSEEEVL